MGQADLSDKTRRGRPKTASDQIHQDRVEELIHENRRIKQKETAVALGISKERVGHIICFLGFRKVCARCGVDVFSSRFYKRKKASPS